MSRSGKEGVYLTPKSETLNRTDEKYAIVWLPDSTWQPALDFSTTVDQSLGLAKSGSDGHWGVRLHTDRFEETFGKVFPTKTVPKVLVTHHLARLRRHLSAPRQTTSELGLRRNPFRVSRLPIRPLNPSTWLVSTVDEIRRHFLTWGSNSILIQPVQRWKEKSRPTILAGQKSQVKPWSDDRDGGEDLLQHNDPWAGVVCCLILCKCSIIQ